MSDEQNTPEVEERGKGPTLTHSQSVKRLDEIHARMEELGELDELSDEEQREFDGLGDEFRSVDEHRKRLERAAKLAEVRTGAAQVPGRRLRIEPGTPSQGSRDDYDRDSILEPDSVEDCRFRNPWDLSEVRTFDRDPSVVAQELRARALSAIEKMPVASDSIRAAATDIVERSDTFDSKIARLALVASSPAYLRAWSKAMTDKKSDMTPEERKAFQQAENYRAMSLTDSAGGYLVPFQLDPTVIVTSAGSRNDIRMAARTVTIASDTWNGISAAAVQWSWDAEATEVSDDSPTFAQPSIPVYKAAGFVPISIEAFQDEANVAQEVGRLLAQGREDLEAVAFITGSGTGQPTGIVTALTGTSSVVGAATDDVFALADVYSLQGSLPARYRGNASWLANNLIYNRIRQFDTAGGAGLWNQVGDDRANVLLGRRVLEAEAMDGTITTSGAVANYAAIFGDFSNYVIVDRIGMTVELIPHLFHTANNRPSGQRGWYAYYRVGADSVNDAAFRMLNVASAA